jgi:hypothetical protein
MSVKAVRRTGGGTDGVSAGRSALSARKNAPTLESSSPIVASGQLEHNFSGPERSIVDSLDHAVLQYYMKYLCVSVIAFHLKSEVA